jgi:hypothetical protein
VADLSTGWGALVNSRYHALYDRDVTDAELWPIVAAMQAGVGLAGGGVRGLTTAEIDTLIIHQSGPPLTQGVGPIIRKDPAPGQQQPGQPDTPIVCSAVGHHCAPWETLGTGADGCPACVTDTTKVLVAAGAVGAALLLMRRR